MIRKSLFIVALGGLALGSGYIYAQPASSPDQPADPADQAQPDESPSSPDSPAPAPAPATPANGAPGDAPEETPDITVPMDKEAQLSPQEMTDKAAEYIGEMQDILRRVVELQQTARKQKDVIKLNCVNDKLLQIKTLLKIAESSRNDLVEAIGEADDSNRYHQYSQITIAYENVTVLRDEASACIGEELIFLGPTEVTVDAPTLPDDPTSEGDEDYIEPPGYASPYS